MTSCHASEQNANFTWAGYICGHLHMYLVSIIHVFTYLWLVSMLYTAHKLIFIILNYHIITGMYMMLCTHLTIYTSNLQGSRV